MRRSLSSIQAIHLNGQSSYLAGIFSAAGTGVYYSGCLSSWVKRLLIRGSNGEVIDDINEYASIHRMMQDVRTDKAQQDNQPRFNKGMARLSRDNCIVPENDSICYYCHHFYVHRRYCRLHRWGVLPLKISSLLAAIF